MGGYAATGEAGLSAVLDIDNGKGALFNLATGRWNIPSGATTTTAADVATNSYDITVAGNDGKLNSALAENTITYASGWKANGADIAGVHVPQNVANP